MGELCGSSVRGYVAALLLPAGASISPKNTAPLLGEIRSISFFTCLAGGVEVDDLDKMGELVRGRGLKSSLSVLLQVSAMGLHMWG